MAGVLMHVKLPKPLAQFAIETFGGMYKIKFDEAEKPVTEYASIGDFFVRHLKPGIRPLGESPILHPADSLISQIGFIENGHCVQAKGKSYSVANLIGDSILADKYQGGIFVTYYLCPTDYHRVHSPVDGEITKITHIPGALWPVNNWSTANIENLFGINERVVVHLKSRVGSALLVFVGATNVGQIRLAFDKSVVTNVPGSPKTQNEKVYDPPIAVSKGQELGAFHMGSTVVMVYPKPIGSQLESWDHLRGKQVKMGEGFL